MINRGFFFLSFITLHVHITAETENSDVPREATLAFKTFCIEKVPVAAAADCLLMLSVSF